MDANLNTISNIGNTQIIAGVDAAKIANGTISNAEFQQLNGITSLAVGISDIQTLTNKTIQGTTNIVDANNLKTTGESVNVSLSPPPIAGQVLTATSSTLSQWITPTNLTAFVSTGSGSITTTPSVSTLKEFYGRSTSIGGIATFNVTLEGTPTGTSIYTNLATAYIRATGKLNTTSNTTVPFCSIQTTSINQKILTINVKT